MEEGEGESARVGHEREEGGEVGTEPGVFGAELGSRGGVADGSAGEEEEEEEEVGEAGVAAGARHCPIFGGGVCVKIAASRLLLARSTRLGYIHHSG